MSGTIQRRRRVRLVEPPSIGNSVLARFAASAGAFLLGNPIAGRPRRGGCNRVG
jgi:hypothetical protein